MCSNSCCCYSTTHLFDSRFGLHRSGHLEHSIWDRCQIVGVWRHKNETYWSTSQHCGVMESVHAEAIKGTKQTDIAVVWASHCCTTLDNPIQLHQVWHVTLSQCTQKLPLKVYMLEKFGHASEVGYYQWGHKNKQSDSQYPLEQPSLLSLNTNFGLVGIKSCIKTWGKAAKFCSCISWGISSPVTHHKARSRIKRNGIICTCCSGPENLIILGTDGLAFMTTIRAYLLLQFSFFLMYSFLSL